MSAQQSFKATPRRLHRSARLRFTLIAVSLLLVAAVVVSARAWNHPASRTVTSVFATPTMASPADVDTISVVLSPHGFTPSDTERASGQFYLTVDNQSGVQGLTLQIKHDRGGMVKEWSVPSGTQTSNELIDLPAGGYVLTEANNPAWLFHITLQ